MKEIRSVLSKVKKLKIIYSLIEKWFWALHIWKRTILTSIIGALGGSSIIGFFNRYALYYHAIKSDFRVPVEGVEYLDLAVTLVSFAIIITSIIGTISIYYILDFLAGVFARVFIKSGDEEKRSKTKRVFLIMQIIATIISLISPFLSDFLSKKKSNVDIPTSIYFISITIILLVFAGYLLSKNSNSRKLFTLVIVSCAVSLITISLFNQKVYTFWLKSIQYGGEIPIQVEYRSADNTKSLVSGKLLLKTKQSITIKKESKIEEIPFNRVSKILYCK